MDAKQIAHCDKGVRGKKAEHACFTKKRLYRLAVRKQIKQGLVNEPDGTWVRKP